MALVARLPRKLLIARMPVEENRVGGRELTWGEGVEEVLKRASHAFPSVHVHDEPTLCAEALPLPLVPQSLVVGGSSSSGRGALARALSGDGGGAPGEAKQRPQPYLMPDVARSRHIELGCCVCAEIPAALAIRGPTTHTQKEGQAGELG
jgi:hypothetical protein